MAMRLPIDPPTLETATAQLRLQGVWARSLLSLLCIHNRNLGSAPTTMCGWPQWLTDALERMVSGRSKAQELERLLPWTWRASGAAAAHA